MGDSLQLGQALAVYWLPDVGIGGGDIKHVHVPLLDVLKYQKPDGTPQTDFVLLFAATFSGTPDNPGPPYLAIPDGILAEMTPATEQSQSNVQILRNKGIKVLLSVTGGHTKVGWHSFPQDYQEKFAVWMRDEVLNRYGIDGIDIDDEWSDALKPDPVSLMRMVGTLRGINPQILITKALWDDTEYFTQPVPQDNPYKPGAYLGEILDFGATMTYGGLPGLIKGTSDYRWVFVNENGVERDVGLGWRILIGVKAGPPSASAVTSVEDVQAVADWLGGKGSIIAPKVIGMMLFTFTQDIQQFTYDPQNDPAHMYPNPNDHEWQRAILNGMWVPVRMPGDRAAVNSAPEAAKPKGKRKPTKKANAAKQAGRTKKSTNKPKGERTNKKAEVIAMMKGTTKPRRRRSWK